MVTRKERFTLGFIQQGIEVPTAEKLGGVAERTAVRRGRADIMDFSLPEPLVPPPSFLAPAPTPSFLAPAPQPVSQPQNIFAPPAPAPAPIIAPVTPYCGIDKIFNPTLNRCETKPTLLCGGKKPYAQEAGGRTFCTEADFLAVYKPKSAVLPVVTSCPKGYYLDTIYGTGKDSRGRSTGKCRPDLFGTYGPSYSSIFG